MGLFRAEILLLAVVVVCGGVASAATKYKLEEAFPKLTLGGTLITDMQEAPDGMLYMISQDGTGYRWAKQADASSAAMWVNISAIVSPGYETGLLGSAFAPDFTTTQNVVLHYSTTARNGYAVGDTVVSRFTLADGFVDVASELVLLHVAQPGNSLNGGQIRFAPASFPAAQRNHLYIALGDGGVEAENNGQNLTTPLGKILRIEVDPATGNVTIPGDNPFATGATCPAAGGCAPEVFAYGLRNPWRFSFDSATGWLWAGDVGQSKYEEIDVIQSGRNYGWSVVEGNECYQPPTGCNKTGMTPPVFVYDHDVGASITGGGVYRGARLPGLVGKYLFTDFLATSLWALAFDGDSPDALTNVRRETVVTDDRLTAGVAAIGFDADGEFYLCHYTTLYRVAVDRSPAALLRVAAPLIAAAVLVATLVAA